MADKLFAKFAGTCQACGCRFDVGTPIVWSKGIGARHETVQQCNDAKVERAKRKADAAPKLDITPIAEFLRAAQQRGLKKPRLRVLAPDNTTEMQLAITIHGVAPGSISVTRGGVFVGCIRPSTNAMTNKLAEDVELQRHLLEVAKDPAAAAKRYAVLMCRCSFCGLQLTDEGSVEVGYGPICAQHWGLPHTPKGTPQLAPVPNGQPQQQTLPNGGRS